MNTAEVYQFPPPTGGKEQRVADTDDGYTRIANELLEAIAGADLTARQLKVMIAVIRKTYGFQKKLDRIADIQIAELTGLSRQNVNKAKKELLSMHCLMMDGNRIGPNKELSAWHFTNSLQKRDSVSKLKTKSVSKIETHEVSKLETHKRNTLKIKEKEPSIPPKGGDGGSLREELISLLEGRFDFDKANALHDAVESAVLEAGYECIREFRVADRGDGRPGRVDLLVSNAEGDVCGIEIDRINVRDKSAIKLKQLADGFILVREGIVSERYELYGVPVISAHPASSAINGISREEALDKAKSALEFYNSMAGSQCRDLKPFLVLLTPTQSRDSYTLEEINTVTRWVLTTWKIRSGSVPKPNNICRVTRFDGYLSDALTWEDGTDRNPSPCPHEQLISIWNAKFPERPIETNEWNKTRPAYRHLERVWNIKTNKGSPREVQHMEMIFGLIRQSSLCQKLEEKPWLNLDWVLKPEKWASVYEQAKAEYQSRKTGTTA